MTTQVVALRRKGVLSDKELIKDFLEDCRLRAFSSGSVESYKSVLKRVSRFLKSKGFGLTDLNKSTLKAVLRYIIEDCGFSHKTLGNYLSALSNSPIT